jgi:hypothetical protein
MVGLRGTNNGRSCCRHSACGDQVRVGTRVRFISIKLGSILISALPPGELNLKSEGNQAKEAVACHIIVDDVLGCRVGFLSGRFLQFQDILNHRCASVVEIYKGPIDSKKRRIDYLNKGFAVCSLY